jgi:acyl-homoserine-lactone acylase
MKRIRIFALLIITLLPALMGLKTAAPDRRAEILWDNWGVPHIFARDTESLFYAFGRAQAHSHGDLETPVRHSALR